MKTLPQVLRFWNRRRVLVLLSIVLGLACSGFAQGQSQGGSYYALVIGINEYRRSLPMLQTAAGDAEAVAKVLSERYGFQVKLLLDGAATRAAILGAMDKYRGSLHEDDSLLIYYAGHGYADRQEEKAYWLPVDAELTTTAQWIIADELTSKMRAYPARHVLVISDSCYSGELLRDGDLAVRPDDLKRYLDKMGAGRSRTLMASGGDEPVSDGGGGGHSVFARALLWALESANERAFTAGDLFHNYLLRQVSGGADQTPEYSSIRNSGDNAGDFVFLQGAAKGKIERTGNEIEGQEPGASSANAGPPRVRAQLGGFSISGDIPPMVTETAKQGQALFYAQQYSEAIPLLRSAAEAGDADAEVELGLVYESGLDIAQDYGEAVKWFRKSAGQGNARAQNDLGLMYETGGGVAQDKVEGAKWIRRSAEQGNAEGEGNLGIAYSLGAGVEKDPAEAAKWYLKAAEQGNAHAQFNLGYAYESGLGVDQDDAEAVKWYRKSADGGDAEGQRSLGVMYERAIGMGKDEVEALKWFRKSAAQGDAGAEYELGTMYEYGRGVKKDLGVALYWYEAASAQVDAPTGAAKGRDELRAKRVVAKRP